MNHGSTSSSDGQPAVELRDWMSCEDHLGNYEQIPDVKPSPLCPVHYWFPSTILYVYVCEIDQDWA